MADNKFSFDDPDWRPFAKEDLDRLRITPNELRFNVTTRAGALLVKQSGQYAEYALGKAGLDHLHDAVREERIPAGLIVLVQRDGRTVTLKKDVAKMVATTVSHRVMGLSDHTGG
jgi:hypothetical protein